MLVIGNTYAASLAATLSYLRELVTGWERNRSLDAVRECRGWGSGR